MHHVPFINIPALKTSATVFFSADCGSATEVCGVICVSQMCSRPLCTWIVLFLWTDCNSSFLPNGNFELTSNVPIIIKHKFSRNTFFFFKRKHKSSVWVWGGCQVHAHERAPARLKETMMKRSHSVDREKIDGRKTLGSPKNKAAASSVSNYLWVRRRGENSPNNHRHPPTA